jgi:hypothetical protein
MPNPFLYYVLNEHGEAVPTHDIARASRQLTDREGRKIAETVLIDVDGAEIVVSTVFLVIDHNYTPGADPLLFETMVFGGRFDQCQDRVHTAVAAQTMHETMVYMIQADIKKRTPKPKKLSRLERPTEAPSNMLLTRECGCQAEFQAATNYHDCTFIGNPECQYYHDRHPYSQERFLNDCRLIRDDKIRRGWPKNEKPRETN